MQAMLIFQRLRCSGHLGCNGKWHRSPCRVWPSSTDNGSLWVWNQPSSGSRPNMPKFGFLDFPPMGWTSMLLAWATVGHLLKWAQIMAIHITDFGCWKNLSTNPGMGLSYPQSFPWIFSASTAQQLLCLPASRSTPGRKQRPRPGGYNVDTSSRSKLRL